MIKFDKDMLPHSDNEAARLATLNSYGILDTPAEQGFDDIVLLASQICQTPVALVSLVAGDRQWFKARVGFHSCETPLSQSVCAHTLRQPGLLVIPDLTTDPRTCANTLVTEPPHIRFYAGARLEAPSRTSLGALCVIDTEPRLEGLTTIQANALEALARQVMAQLELRRVIAAEKATSALREQFIAVLGHDLRNPVAAIDGGMSLLQKMPLPERAATIAGMAQSSARRMAILIDNLLDLARGRLGGGLILDRNSGEPLEPFLAHIIAELQSSHHDRRIEVDFDIQQPVECDRFRVGQLFSNLLGNALTHGTPDVPIRVEAATHGSVFDLSVTNGGECIPPAVLENLFQPFFRAASRPGQKGLGLGLYIASEIARAHDGDLTVSSSPGQTRFTFRMPLHRQTMRLA